MADATYEKLSMNKKSVSWVVAFIRQELFSSFSLAAILSTTGVFLAAFSVVLITSLLNESAAHTMAEKTAMVMVQQTSQLVAGSLSGAAQLSAASPAGLLVAPNATMPYLDDPSTWFIKWQSLGILYERSLGLQAHMVSFIFDDGSYLGVAREASRGLRLQCWRKLGDNTPAPDANETLPFVPVIQNEFNYSTMEYIESIDYSSQLEARLRPHYNRSMPLFSVAYSSVLLSGDGYPTVVVSYPFFNTSRAFMGIGEVRLSLEILVRTLVASARPTSTSHVVIMDRERNIIATSVPSPAYHTAPINTSYVITAADTANGCSLATSNGVRVLMCLKSVETFDYAPLNELYNMRLIPGKGEQIANEADTVRRVELESTGDGYYIALAEYGQFPGLDWVSLVIIPESEMLEEVVKARSISIGVSIAIMIFVAIVTGLLMRVFLHPLSDIARKMQSAAFMSDDSSSSAESSDNMSSHANSSGGGYKHVLEAADKPKPKPKVIRILSNLTDVAAIQQAYWNMADELRLLRGYIPEHIRKQLLEARRSPAKYSTDNDTLLAAAAAFERNLYPSGVMPSDAISMDVISAPTRSGSRSHSHSSDSGKIKGTADASTLPTATQPAFDAEAIKRWDSNNVAEKVEVSPSESDSSPSNNEDMHPPPMTTAGETTAVPPPTSYTENGLVQRNLSVVVINILGLHQYVQATPLEQVVKEHEAFVSYLHEAAKRFGGALDNFNGDKFWVSFNATVPCEDICVAATLFALEIATTVKKEMLSHQRSREASVGKPPLYMKQPLTQVAWRGVSMGVAAGKGFVGTLGTNKIRRHTITSGAVAEAAALERMAARYPDCSVLVSESLLPMIEGYFQYIVLDATALPGSGGKRRRIISIRAPMLSSIKRLSPALTRFAHKIRSPLPVRTPYRAINECFSAFLEGRPQIEITNRLSEISNHMELSRQANPTFPKLPDGRMTLSESECANISMMIHYIYSLSGGAGASYCGPLGNLFEKV